MTDRQLQRMKFIAKDFYARAIFHNVPRAYFVMQCVVTGMLVAWEVPEREGDRADRVMREVVGEVARMSSKELEKYCLTRESEWKYWQT